jgi:hypothetical protein
VRCSESLSTLKRQAEGSLSYISPSPAWDRPVMTRSVHFVSLLLAVLITSIYYRSEDLTPIRAE